MSRYELKVEKRILPLLDITLILVGILILIIGTPQFGEHRVFALEISGHQILDGDSIIASGDELHETAARNMLTRAIVGGFNRIEIRNTETRYPLSARKITEIEQKLTSMASELSEELQIPHSINIKQQSKP